MSAFQLSSLIPPFFGVCLCLCLNSVLGCCEREEGWCIGMISALFFLFQYHLWISYSLFMPLIHHYLSPLSNSLFPFPSNPSSVCVCVCECAQLWMMQWPFRWHGPAWPSPDTTGLNSIHHNSIHLLPSQAGKHTFVCLGVKSKNATVYRREFIEKNMHKSADAGRQRGGGGLDRQCEETTRLFRS